MPFVRQRPDLNLTSQIYDELVKISKSRSEKASRVERAKMLILYHDGVSISAIARKLSTNRPKVERCIDKALQLGALTALDDLDNHSAHISRETRKYLAAVPNRFELIFTPKHGSWLNIIECLFAKMAKTFLRAIRVDSKEELKQRILKWLKEINESPVIFRWKYGLDVISIN